MQCRQPCDDKGLQFLFSLFTVPEWRTMTKMPSLPVGRASNARSTSSPAVTFPNPHTAQGPAQGARQSALAGFGFAGGGSPGTGAGAEVGGMEVAHKEALTNARAHECQELTNARAPSHNLCRGCTHLAVPRCGAFPSSIERRSPRLLGSSYLGHTGAQQTTPHHGTAQHRRALSPAAVCASLAAEGACAWLLCPRTPALPRSLPLSSSCAWFGFSMGILGACGQVS